MNEMKLLTLLELRNLYGINKILHTKDKKEKQRCIAMAVLWCLLGGIIIFYAGTYIYALVKLELSEIVPSFLVMVPSLLILFLGSFKAGNVIFAEKGYDFLCSLPVRKKSIVMSRFFSMYVEYLIVTLLVMITGLLVYGICVKPGIHVYLILLVGAFFVPLLPLVVAVLINTLILAIASRMKHKSMAQTVLSIALVVLIFLGSFGMEELPKETSMETMKHLAGIIERVMGKCYPPAIWVKDAVMNKNAGGFLFFLAISLIATIVMLLIVSANFQTISRRLFANSAKHNYQVGVMKRRGMFTSFYLKEAKRYFSSSVYVTNTVMGPVMATLLSAGILVVGVEELQNLLQIPLDVTILIPMFIAACLGLMPMSAVSVSMEGKHFWLAKTLPIPTKVFLDAKIFFNLSFLFPFYFLCEVMLIMALKPKGLELVWLILIPALISLLVVVLGISINLKLYSFDWEKEITVVKQSASSMIGCLGGLVVSSVWGVLVAFIPDQWRNLTNCMACVIVFAVTIVMYHRNNKVRLQEL